MQTNPAVDEKTSNGQIVRAVSRV